MDIIFRFDSCNRIHEHSVDRRYFCLYRSLRHSFRLYLSLCHSFRLYLSLCRMLCIHIFERIVVFFCQIEPKMQKLIQIH